MAGEADGVIGGGSPFGKVKGGGGEGDSGGVVVEYRSGEAVGGESGSPASGGVVEGENQGFVGFDDRIPKNLHRNDRRLRTRFKRNGSVCLRDIRPADGEVVVVGTVAGSPTEGEIDGTGLFDRPAAGNGKVNGLAAAITFIPAAGIQTQFVGDVVIDNSRNDGTDIQGGGIVGIVAGGNGMGNAAAEGSCRIVVVDRPNVHRQGIETVRIGEKDISGTAKAGVIPTHFHPIGCGDGNGDIAAGGTGEGKFVAVGGSVFAHFRIAIGFGDRDVGTIVIDNSRGDILDGYAVVAATAGTVRDRTGGVSVDIGFVGGGDGDGLRRIPVGGGKGEGPNGLHFAVGGETDGDIVRGFGIEYHRVATRCPPFGGVDVGGTDRYSSGVVVIGGDGDGLVS